MKHLFLLSEFEYSSILWKQSVQNFNYLDFDLDIISWIYLPENIRDHNRTEAHAVTTWSQWAFGLFVYKKKEKKKKRKFSWVSNLQSFVFKDSELMVCSTITGRIE